MFEDLAADYRELSMELEQAREQLSWLLCKQDEHQAGQSPLAGSALWAELCGALLLVKNAEQTLISYRGVMLGAKTLDTVKPTRRKRHE